MPTEGNPSQETPPPLLEADEPAPFVVSNPEATAPLLLVCDHASRRIPRGLGTLGLDPVARRCHLAWDIGAGRLTERLAAALGVTAVSAQYSRLVVDCNRDLLDPGAFLEYGDGVVIHGNRALTPVAKQLRAASLYWPYHRAIDAELARLNGCGPKPTVVAVHSFTPVLNGISRPWEIGVLSDVDRPTAERFLDGFRAAGFLVGDNEPYSGKAPADFTIDHHAEAAGLPHVGIEIRQDLIDDEAGVAKIGDVLFEIVAGLIAVEPRPANDDDCGAPGSSSTTNA